MSDAPSTRRKRLPPGRAAAAGPEQAASGLSRRYLEAGRMREIYQAAVEPGRTLCDEALSQSLNATLAARPKGAGWWVFAYGSLLWNPIFPIAESRAAQLRGDHPRWRREMVVGSYAPRWVTLHAEGRPIVGLAFVVRRDHPQYAGGLAPARQADVIASACGHLGSSRDYLERTRVALVSHGIVDPYLERIAAAVRARN